MAFLNTAAMDVEAVPWLCYALYLMVTKDRALLFAEEGFAAGEDTSAENVWKKPVWRFIRMTGSMKC